MLVAAIGLAAGGFAGIRVAHRVHGTSPQAERAMRLRAESVLGELAETQAKNAALQREALALDRKLRR